MSSPPDVVLASASPRRRELLERLGLVVQVEPADIDETARPGESARDHALRLAVEKCDVVATRLGLAQLPVVGADTIVALDGEIFGKPRDAADATRMLRRLTGRRHDVMTAFRVRMGEKTAERVVTSTVSFRLLDPEEIEAYVASGEWDGKAGGYAIQGVAAAFCDELRGSPTNVIGLPLCEVLADLRALGGLPTFPPVGFGRQR